LLALGAADDHRVRVVFRLTATRAGRAISPRIAA